MLMRLETGSGFATAIYDRNTVRNILPQWRALADSAVEDCVYYAPHYALPLLDTVAASADVHFAAAWRNDALAALLPVVNERRVPGLVRFGRAWQTPYTFSSTPLLDRHCPLEAAEALIGLLAEMLPGEWIIPAVNAEGAAARAFKEALARRAAPWIELGSFERASLSAHASFEDHMKACISSKRRRDLGRNRRRLEELGAVRHAIARDGAALDAALQAFLKLEAGGWKGKRGTALSCQSETRAFAEQAFGSAGGQSNTRIDMLVLNEKPIAAGITAFSGSTGFTVKCAYDEAYANYGAGLLLEIEVIRSFLTERWAARLDAATNGSHVIDGLWPDRVAVADLVFSLAATAPTKRLAAYCWAHGQKSRLKAALKRWLKR
jgi:CelD/BcsL family acetyltransferase involved in cellulose biosynthesis